MGLTVNLTGMAVYASTLDAAKETKYSFIMTFRTQFAEFPQETR